MSFSIAKPFPVLPGLIVDPTSRGAADHAPVSVSVRDSGTYLNIYHPASGMTFCQRVSKSRDVADVVVPVLSDDQVAGTRRTLITVGAIMCIPVFTAVIGLPMIMLGLAWPQIVRTAGALRTA